MPTELREALRTLLRECTNDYAKAYAQHMLSDGDWMKPDERRTQINYILSNTGAWRGDTARSVKATLRNY